MATFKINNQSRNQRNIISKTSSQRNSASVVFYRYSDPNIIKPAAANIKNTALYGGSGSAASGNLNELNRLQIDNDIVRINIDKNKGTPSGNWSVTLRRGRSERGEPLTNGNNINYLKAIQPGDWVMIYLRKSGTVNPSGVDKNSGLKCIGIVENVRYVERDDPNSSRPILEYIVTGRDFGKVFEMDLFFNPILNKGQIGLLAGVGLFKDAKEGGKPSASDAKGIKDSKKEFTPDAVMDKAVNLYLGDSAGGLTTVNQTWYVPRSLASFYLPKGFKGSGVGFVNILEKQIGLQSYSNQSPGASPRTSALLGTKVFTSLPAEGNIWQTLDYLSHPVLNEIYTELKLIDNKLTPTFVHRQYPYGGSGDTSVENVISSFGGGSGSSGLSSSEQTLFKDITRHEIQADDIKQKNVGKSDFERVNQLVVTPRVIGTNEIKKLYGSIGNIPSIQRYGLKSIQSQTDYADGDISDTFIEKILSILADWFFLSHLFYNGTFILDGFDENIEIGNNLYISDIKHLYHIEGYTHTYEQDSASAKINYTTTVRVSRGCKVKNNSSLTFIDGDANTDAISVVSSNLENIRNNPR